jgi:hypothetical protein
MHKADIINALSRELQQVFNDVATALGLVANQGEVVPDRVKVPGAVLPVCKVAAGQTRIRVCPPEDC